MELDVRYRLRVNPITCTGHGLCAELLPEIIELDPWGYPILSSSAVPIGVVDHAKRAVDACPTLALLMDEVEEVAGDSW
ncbi:MAG TPA: ferredoxin [Streptosporangiaceae bacterium]|nr:ferredoxin [Streptosporangiaceae bacterium]